MSSIANTIKNPRLHDANRPFGQAPMVKGRPQYTDPAALEICDDPLPTGRASSGHKYGTVFATLKLGQAIKCAPADVGRIAGALRKFVDLKGMRASIRTIKDYGDGKGRVWLLKDDKPGRGKVAK